MGIKAQHVDEGENSSMAIDDAEAEMRQYIGSFASDINCIEDNRDRWLENARKSFLQQMLIYRKVSIESGRREFKIIVCMLMWNYSIHDISRIQTTLCLKESSVDTGFARHVRQQSLNSINLQSSAAHSKYSDGQNRRSGLKWGKSTTMLILRRTWTSKANLHFNGRNDTFHCKWCSQNILHVRQSHFNSEAISSQSVRYITESCPEEISHRKINSGSYEPT